MASDERRLTLTITLPLGSAKQHLQAALTLLTTVGDAPLDAQRLQRARREVGEALSELGKMG